MTSYQSRQRINHCLAILNWVTFWWRTWFNVIIILCVKTFSFQLVLSFLGSSWSRYPLSGHYDNALCWNAGERKKIDNIYDSFFYYRNSLSSSYTSCIYWDIFLRTIESEALYLATNKPSAKYVLGCDFVLTSWVRVSSDFPRLILWLVEPCRRDLQTQKADHKIQGLDSKAQVSKFLSVHQSVRQTCALAARDAGHWVWSVLWQAGLQKIHFVSAVLCKRLETQTQYSLQYQ